MVEPVTLTAAAIATIIATKAFEKTGEKIVDAVGGLISNSIRYKSICNGKLN